MDTSGVDIQAVGSIIEEFFMVGKDVNSKEHQQMVQRLMDGGIHRTYCIPAILNPGRLMIQPVPNSYQSPPSEAYLLVQDSIPI